MEETSLKFIDSFLRKFRRFGIPNITTYYVAISGGLFLAERLNLIPLIPVSSLSGFVFFCIYMLFAPGPGNIFFVLIGLYCTFMIGRYLEGAWGYGKLTVYLLLAAVFNLISTFAFSVGLGFSTITMSMFIALAAMAPDMIFSFMFIIPVKAKYLAAIMIAIIVVEQLRYNFHLNTILGLIIALGAPIIFFWEDARFSIKNFIRHQKFKRRMR